MSTSPSPTITPPVGTHAPRVLGRVAAENFVGREAALREIDALATNGQGRSGLLLLAAPASGASELLRQAYDALFARRGGASPVYFALTPLDRAAPADAAIRFLHTFLTQLIAYRRGDASLVLAPPLLSELPDLAPPVDYEWIERLVRTYERMRSAGGDDQRSLIYFCLGAVREAAARGAHAIVLVDDVHQLAPTAGETSPLASALAGHATRSETTFVLSGLRRRLLDALDVPAGGDRAARFDNFGVLRLDRLSPADARILIDRIARARGVVVNEETRDLLAQQCEGSPPHLEALLDAARRSGQAFDSFLAVQKTYVDQLLGGRLHRRFNAVIEEIAPTLPSRRALLRALHDTAENAGGKLSAEAWRRRLELAPSQPDRALAGLHAHELASFNGGYVEVGGGHIWRDYLRANYRLQVAAEPRALVVADTLIAALKRAPQTMARHYRREAAPDLRRLLTLFDRQQVSASLLQHGQFSERYRGVGEVETRAALDAETDFVRLPQIVHAATCASFHTSALAACDDERCVAAHGFDAGPYAEAGEVVWLAAEIEDKGEAGRALTQVWCDRLTQLARNCGFRRPQLWLVAAGGFSAEACELLQERTAYSSDRRQLDLLHACLHPEAPAAATVSGDEEMEPAYDEVEMVIPMGSDTELIAAQTAEQIARRLGFTSEAINQIKTAVIEACINAAEHSLSPERKIYQRLRAESDKLTVIISSRGITAPVAVPTNINGQDAGDGLKGRRGWGLKLIRTLMDEVEFERVDDGTRLRMTKHLRP